MVVGRGTPGRCGASTRGRAPSRVLAALLPGALLLGLVGSGPLACGGDAATRPERHHASLEAFRDAETTRDAKTTRDAEATRDAGPRRRVVLVGIDGASWSYLHPLLEAGALPSLARAVARGASATLRSVECHFTPPAWTTMLTGQLPHRTGIYSFGSWNEDTREFSKVTSNEVRVPAVWDVAGRAGRRVSVIGVPVTHPPQPVNGVLVAGLMTPKTRLPPLSLSLAPERRRPLDASLVSFSPALTASLADEHNVLLPTYLDGEDDGNVRYDEIHLRVLRKGLGPVATRELGTYRFPVGEFSPWVGVRLGPGPIAPEGFLKLRFAPPSGGGISYLLTPTFLPARRPFTSPPSLTQELYDRFGYYLPHEFLSIGVLPSVTAEAVDHARYFFGQPDWDLLLTVFGQSDNAHHLIGFGEQALPVYQRIDAFVGEVLDGLGPHDTLVIASDHGFGPFDHAIDLNQWLAREGLLVWKAAGVIDHERTLVFHNLWHLHMNRALLDAATLRSRGIAVAEGSAPADALAEHLITAARALRSDDGTPFPVRLARLPEHAVGNAPDLAVRAHDDVWIEFWNVDHPSTRVVRPLEGDDRWKHARDGILVVVGDGVRAGSDLGVVDIQHVAPTLLDRLGLPVADDWDGQPIPGLLDAERALATPLHRVPSFGALARDAVVPDDDPATFEETLRALGYLAD